MKRFILPVFILIILFFLPFSCRETSPGADSSTGEELARIHCASCHLFPEPELLDKKSWDQYILPRMGYMLGHLPADSVPKGYIEESAKKIAFRNPMLFRQESPLNDSDWEKIRAFYIENAPAEAIRAEVRPVKKELPQFVVQKPDFKLSPPSTTMARFSGENILFGDANTKRLYQLNSMLEPMSIANVREGAVWLNETEEEIRLVVMGSFSPTDQESGFLMSLPKTPGGGTRILIDSLRRPVHADFGDLNGDGREDVVICEFAKWTGKLSWWEQLPSGEYQEHLLRNMPGAIKAYIRDMDQDGKKDIIALFGQADEGIFLFYNEGGGRFREERVLRFSPSHGSSFFDLCEINGDGHPDIIYTNGDNADFPPVVKKYHGIHLYQNDGANQFEEVLFYPQYGAYGAIPEDFDKDGDIDLAAISFFPDFQQQPEQSFLYLENQGNWEFEAFTFPEFLSGRWIVMDAGDPDQDGDTDLILGSLTFEVVPQMGLVDKWVEGGLPFILLQNQQ
jgi:hypothetical protein